MKINYGLLIASVRPSENLHRVPPCSVTFIVELLSRSEGPIVINRMGSPSIRKMHEIKRYPSDNIGQNSCARSNCLRFCTTLRSSCHWHHKVLVSIGHFQFVMKCFSFYQSNLFNNHVIFGEIQSLQRYKIVIVTNTMTPSS